MALKTISKENKSNKIDTQIHDRSTLKSRDVRCSKINKQLRLSHKAIQSNYSETANAMALSTYCPQYQYFPCPIAFTEWNQILPMSSLYTVPVPVLINPAPVIPAICPYVPPIGIPPVISAVVVSNHTSSNNYESVSEAETVEANYTYGSDCVKDLSDNEDPMVYYLTLPKDLFPSARMMTVDPNGLIEEFCILPNIYRHAAWILDLEFGVPKSPITRPIPCYNVKFNSVHCKNTPDAIHPGFESCNQDFKRVFLFYYDCIVSAWYRSYVFLTCDKSVENFQKWLRFPMQELGMCWS